MQACFNDLAYAYGQPEAQGCLKAQNIDFRVEEMMPIEMSGEGEHLWLKVEKDGANTDWVAQQLARHAGLKSIAVSYAGMKDRHAIATQWFSLHLPGMADPDFSGLISDEFKIIKQIRHNRKLKRGALSGNRFKIRMSDLEADVDILNERLSKIQQNGVPNYFGEQRFGRQMGNLIKAEKMFNRELKKISKQHRSLYLSSARSWIFNQILSARIQHENWLTPIAGDVFMLNGKSACFVDDMSDELSQRLQAKDINITACLWGEGESMATAETFDLEQSVAKDFDVFSKGLEDARLKQERRSMRLVPENMQWQINKDSLDIQFQLPAGTFATMVLRECIGLKS